MTRGLIGLPLAALAAAAAPRQRPDFSGDWVLDRTASRPEYPRLEQLDSGSVRIEHTAAAFRFIRRFVLGGRSDTLSWTLVPDGPEDTTSEGAAREYSRLRWAADTLLFESRTVTPRGEAGDTVRYGLEDGGRRFVAAERFRAPRLKYDNRWVFTRR